MARLLGFANSKNELCKIGTLTRNFFVGIFLWEFFVGIFLVGSLFLEPAVHIFLK